MNNIKTIGVLTSGGDSPGMNAAIRAVVRAGSYYGLRVMGIRKGYNGLISGDIFELDARMVSDTLQRGGTILQTARCMEFKTPEGLKKATDVIKEYGIDALVVIGGDGSFRGAKDLCALGVPAIAIPGTIDNDISCTDYTIGFDTALHTVVEAVDKIRDTATSHERCSVIEVMGNRAGYIALFSAITTGAEVVLIPEKSYDFDKDVIEPILDGKKRGKKHYIVIVAEGVGSAFDIADKIGEKTGVEARGTNLGHVQRGGSPSMYDRLIASRMGVYAVKLLLDGKSKRVVALKDNKIVDYDIDEALAMTKEISPELLEIAKILSI